MRTHVDSAPLFVCLKQTGICCTRQAQIVDYSALRWKQKPRSCVCVNINSFHCDLSQMFMSQVRTTDNRLSLCEAMHHCMDEHMHPVCVLDSIQKLE